MSRTAGVASLSVTLAFVALAGCAQAIDDGGKPDSVVDLQDTSAEGPAAPAGGSSANDSTAIPSAGTSVYFNEPNYIQPPPNEAASYTFDLLEDSRIGIHLARATETGPQDIGFTLYRVVSEEKNVVVGQVADTDGSADAELWSEHGGTYLIEVAGGQSPSAYVLDLSCLSGQCTKLRQPGQVCGSSDPYLCASGLVCRFSDGQCKAGDTPATCQIPPSSCEKTHAPVCGCDGQTWGNECYARAAGVSVLKNGECGTGK